MNKQAYSGAYSRRFNDAELLASKPTVSAHKQLNLEIKTLNVSWNGAMGKVTGTGNYAVDTSNTPANSGKATAIKGDSIKLTATADKGYHFSHWEGTPIKSVLDPEISIQMMNDYNVTAVFEADKQDPETPTGGGNGASPTGTSTVGVIVEKAKPFVKKWWWAILIVAYIAYKEWKGAKK